MYTYTIVLYINKEINPQTQNSSNPHNKKINLNEVTL